MYNFKNIEKKWQEYWEKNKTFKMIENSNKPKKYVLDMFPYPSGSGLHVGHPLGYIATDIISRYYRMNNFNILHPMGWDAFGLPAEQYAIESGRHPGEFTDINIATYKKQISILGLSYDWDKEIATTDPSYFKWTQWIFIQLYNKGLAELQEVEVNWCEKLGTVLANEEVLNKDGVMVSERGEHPVIKKPMKQWVLKITKYADRLLEDLDLLDWPEGIKAMQRNWIGRSEGAIIKFNIKNYNNSFEVFTTRADTLFGATYCVLAPEHELVSKITTSDKKEEVEKYIEFAKAKSDLDRTELNKDKSGVFTGAYAINPVNNKEIPIWIADYVLSSYGTGAIMAVPAHDERDYEFATKFNIPIIQVIAPTYMATGNDAPKSDAKNTKRDIVCIVLKHHTEDKYLILDWQKQNWKSFVCGGIEENETIEESAIKEVKEETGYQNIIIDKVSNFKFFDKFYAHHKEVNREVTQHIVYAHIINDEKLEINNSELENHIPLWVTKEEVFNLINKPNKECLTWFFPTEKAWTTDGVMINSEFLNNLDNKKDSINKMIEYLEANNYGRKAVNYKLRDWLFSRQRYWGEPFPVIHWEDNTISVLDEKDLPLTLPVMDNIKPSGTGESPLANAKEWLEVIREDGVKGRRETNTMPQWAGSCWYYIGYLLKNDDNTFKPLSDPKVQAYINEWLPVDFYLGGAEHAVLHLLYSRFWHKVLYDCGVVNSKEPFQKLFNQGMLLGENNEKMSKSRGNVVNPDDIVNSHGADSLRLFEMFMGPLEAEKKWSTTGLDGSKKFLDRVWRIFEEISFTENDNLDKIYNQTIKKVTDYYNNLGFNTAISQLMIFINEVYKQKQITKNHAEGFIKILSPIAPHISEEIWQSFLGHTNTITYETWPTYDESKLISDTYEMVVQVNGKVRGKVEVTNEISDEEIKNIALNIDNVKLHIDNKEILKIIIIPKKIVSIVI